MKIPGIISITLFGASIFAAPHPNSGLARRLERREAARATRTTNPVKFVGPKTYVAEKKNGTNSTHVSYSTNWAGAVLTAPPAGETFNSVSAEFVVPTVSVPSGSSSGDYSASAWVGIDGDTYGNAIWQSGVDFTISDGEYTFDAWYEWFPSPSVDISSFSFTAGDTVSITVSSSDNSHGSIILENVSTGQTVTESANAPSSSAVLRGQNADWIVEDFDIGGSQVPFANFGTILFTDAVASTSSQSVGTDGASIIEIKDSDGNIVTDVTLPSSSEVMVVYV
jgi:hypothetical protein